MSATPLQIGPWRAERDSCRLYGATATRDVEPKVMDLLFLLASRPGVIFPHADILAALWPRVTVDGDTLARCIFKLRRALGDTTRPPRYVETVPKRGYRLIALAPVDEIGTLIRRADAFYFQFRHADNEAAIALYERVLAVAAGDAAALAGLANARVQRVVRWLDIKDGVARTSLGEARASGVLSSDAARAQLAEALDLAEQAVAAAPEDSAALKALGLVLSAQGRLDDAEDVYRSILTRDRDAWGVLINLADLEGLRGRDGEALHLLQQAHAIMTRLYDSQIARIRPWYAPTGCAIAARHASAGHAAEAERWYRRVLADAPLEEAAVVGLATLLAVRGAGAEARALCGDLIDRLGGNAACESFLARHAA